MPSISSLLAGDWCVIPDISAPHLFPPAGGRGFPPRPLTPQWPTLGQGPFTVFFDTPYARNWAGGLSLVKPSGALVLIPAGDLLYGVNATAGALIPSQEFVAYTFAAGDLDEQGEWTVYLTSPREAGGTGQGVANAGSGTGNFLVVRG